MANDFKKLDELEEQIQSELKKRPRSATLLNLGWLAEKIRKQPKLKDEIDKQQYSINSEKLAKAMLDED